MNRLTQFFPLIAGTASALALWRPELFTWFGPLFIKVSLALIMFFTGLSLTVADFKRIALSPAPVAVGFGLQYTVMPFMGWLAAEVFQLPREAAAGLILVACCPGGTASNIITYLARADVPLSVSMTAVSTLAAAVVTPALSAWLIGARVPVDVLSMMADTAIVILLPIALALVAQRLLSSLTSRLVSSANFLAVVAVTLIVASIIGSSRERILTGGWKIVAAVFVLHSGGFLLGYFFARGLRMDIIRARTISIEVGMQNSGLGVVLATRHLGAMAAVPCAISSLMHSLIGSVLAAYFSRRTGGPRGDGGQDALFAGGRRTGAAASAAEPGPRGDGGQDALLAGAKGAEVA